MAASTWPRPCVCRGRSTQPMVEMAMTGPPMQQALPWPKYQAPITVFRPEEMIECSEPEAARKWANMEWLKFEHRMIAANATEGNSINTTRHSRWGHKYEHSAIGKVETSASTVFRLAGGKEEPFVTITYEATITRSGRDCGD